MLPTCIGMWDLKFSTLTLKRNSFTPLASHVGMFPLLPTVLQAPRLVVQTTSIAAGFHGVKCDTWYSGKSCGETTGRPPAGFGSHTAASRGRSPLDTVDHGSPGSYSNFKVNSQMFSYKTKQKVAKQQQVNYGTPASLQNFNILIGWAVHTVGAVEGWPLESPGVPWERCHGVVEWWSGGGRRRQGCTVGGATVTSTK